MIMFPYSTTEINPSLHKVGSNVKTVGCNIKQMDNNKCKGILGILVSKCCTPAKTGLRECSSSSSRIQKKT